MAVIDRFILNIKGLYCVERSEGYAEGQQCNWYWCLYNYLAFIITLVLDWVERGGEIVYSIISFYLVLPISSFVISCVWCTKRTMKKWCLPVFFGCMAMLLGVFTFDLANTMVTHKMHIPDFKMAFISAVPSLLGLLIGTGVTVSGKYN